LTRPKVALVHDYLVIRGGAERALLALSRVFPDAPIYTSIYRPDTTLPAFAQLDVRPLWSDRLPGDARTYRMWIMAFALAFEGLRLKGYDLVISNSSGFAKSAGADALRRFAWCQTPPRFLWPTGGSGEPPSRLEAVGRLGLAPVLRQLDVRAAKRVDLFAANSVNVQDRIARFYGQDSRILYPPIDTGLFRPIVTTAGREDFFLLVGRMVRYKRFDVVIEAFNRLGRRLVICGTGPDRARLEAIAGPTVHFLGHVPDEDLVGLYSKALAVIVPGEEDWGMIGLEANACGCPVVAAAWGGSVESVRDGVTGVLYDPGQPDALASAIGRLETISFDPNLLREHAAGYGEERFEDRVTEIIDPLLQVSSR
jgi:glycosyltransferase involved in cell wall biosynthesis